VQTVRQQGRVEKEAALVCNYNISSELCIAIIIRYGVMNSHIELG
jgi:hypothetical protein